MCHHLSGMLAALARDNAEGYVDSSARRRPDATDTTTPPADTAPTSTENPARTAQATITEGDRR
ncbi:hypothetical protein [Saccharomonospora cyanea]|uniref:Uncharacterized protein n=1 Tax=Saccharomonospora cyanea NA-134 TaxID=882082 RepID=H5XPE6_9PSEU|nr:hypothetical protein [Saccharomonospora cyanea]EHR58980.1 hypothetical protein SaccyDRAFT_0038 [Saccharomonospora cyanea NA-134]